MAKTTLARIWWPLMECPVIRLERCPICWRVRPLNQHHMVKLSAGELFDAYGRKRKKPTITLCGFGNNLRDANGRYYCHGLAHHEMLHFRWVPTYEAKGSTYPKLDGGHLEYLLTDEPTKYDAALNMDGWQRVRTDWQSDELWVC